MISRIRHRSVVRIVAMLALASWITACGYKGPLYMPAKPTPFKPDSSPDSMYGITPDEGTTTIPFLDEDLMLAPMPIVIE
ncbi:LPS translocon maturation chaperone LptM [Sheuella amnicola]|nr:lipoprotein [Sheuella amnicola]